MNLENRYHDQQYCPLEKEKKYSCQKLNKLNGSWILSPWKGKIIFLMKALFEAKWAFIEYLLKTINKSLVSVSQCIQSQSTLLLGSQYVLPSS